VRVASDHEAVDTHRSSVERVGRTRRPRIPLPDAVEAEGVVRLTVGGSRYHARVEQGLAGDRDLRGAYDNARLARTGDGENRLRAWIEAAEADGETVLIDVVTPGYHYGLRLPGDRTVYEPVDPPSSSLVDLARDLDG
jgi:hypothetical protein